MSVSLSFFYKGAREYSIKVHTEKNQFSRKNTRHTPDFQFFNVLFFNLELGLPGITTGSGYL